MTLIHFLKQRKMAYLFCVLRLNIEVVIVENPTIRNQTGTLKIIHVPRGV